MRIPYLLIAFILTLTVAGLAWYVGDPVRVTSPENGDVRQAIIKGLSFLRQAHSPYAFADEYLQYVYPNEDLLCDIEGCDLTYRLLDAYFGLSMLQDRLQADEQNIIRDLLHEQKNVFAHLLPQWRTAEIAETVLSDPAAEHTIALDTYCILGYLLEDKVMAENALRFLPESGEWFLADHFLTDQWRNIADETWCIRLLAATETFPEQFNTMVETKTIEARGFIRSDKPVAEKIAAIYHVLLMLQEPNISVRQEDIMHFQNEAAALLSSASTELDAVTMANSLEMFTLTDFTYTDYQKGLAEALLREQRDDGSWRFDESTQYSVFGTLRAVIALATYRQAGI